MGWWNIENNDVLGDAPADTMTAAITELVANYKPTLKECTTAILAAIIGHENELLESGHPPLNGNLLLRGKLLISVDEAKISHNKAIVDILKTPLQRISNAYLDACGRRPRISEIFATFIFSLSSEPEGFIDDANNLRPGDLHLKTD